MSKWEKKELQKNRIKNLVEETKEEKGTETGDVIRR